VKLTKTEWLDLEWWEAKLHAPKKFRHIELNKEHWECISFGDGSGSGTGGTVQILG
jgi:hypothetical protein